MNNAHLPDLNIFWHALFSLKRLSTGEMKTCNISCTNPNTFFFAFVRRWNDRYESFQSYGLKWTESIFSFTCSLRPWYAEIFTCLSVKHVWAVCKWRKLFKSVTFSLRVLTLHSGKLDGETIKVNKGIGNEDILAWSVLKRGRLR